MKKMNKEDNDRYQNQPWYIKLWRRRYYLLIPYFTIVCYLYNIFMVSKNEERLSLNKCWKINIGLAQMKMKWYYDWNEMKEKLDKIDKIKDGQNRLNKNV